MKLGIGQLTFAAVLLFAVCHPASAELRRSLDRGKFPISFEPNVGQAAADVAFVARGQRHTTSLLPAGARLSLDGAPLMIEFVGGNRAASLRPHDTLPGTVNYFLGSTAAGWRSAVPTYRTVRAGDVYDGVDVVYYGREGLLEYDFIVAPGVDPDVIRIAFANARRLRLTAEGDLTMLVEGREMRQRKPYIYQDLPAGRRQVAGGYVVAGNSVRFSIGRYDRSLPLVIDPVLVYSSYWGGPTGDGVAAIAVDRTGSAYLASNFNALAGGGGDIAVTKIDPTGSFILYVAYLGGRDQDDAWDIAVDPAGFAHVTGSTRSEDFPTVNAYQSSLGQTVFDGDGFVAKLGVEGNTLVYSTYLGGSGNDWATGIALAPNGDAVVVGLTGSRDFPIKDALQPNHRGGSDAFVTRLAASGSHLVYSTYLGGSGIDQPQGVGLDSAGHVYVSGFTESADFPVVNAVQELLGGGQDGFMVKMQPDASAILYATYFGGVTNEIVFGMDVTPDGRAVACGITFAPGFPMLNAALSGLRGITDAFVVLLHSSGADGYAMYLGGSGEDACYGAAIDAAGRAHVTGQTSSADFPTLNAFQPAISGGEDAFVTIIDPTGTIIASSYLGGSGQDGGGDIAVEPAGAVYVSGSTQSTDFPVTSAALQRTHAGGDSDGFVTKLDPLCGPDVTAALDIGLAIDLEIPLTPWRVQLLLVRNRTADPLGGPLTLVLTDLTNGTLFSPWATACIDGASSPFTIVTGGTDGVLSPGEIGGQWLLFFEPGASVSYIPRVLSGVPGR